MKIINIKTAFLLPVIFAGLALTGCSNEDIAEEKVQEGMGAVSFTISEKDYEPAEEVASTRATVHYTCCRAKSKDTCYQQTNSLHYPGLPR